MAPAFMARTEVGTSPWPVAKMSGIFQPAFGGRRERDSQHDGAQHHARQVEARN